MNERQRKIRTYLFINISLALTIIGLIIFILMNITSNSFLPSLMLIIAIILTFALLKSNSKFNYLKHERILYSIYFNKELPLSTNKQLFINSYAEKLKEKIGLIKLHTIKNTEMYYKIEPGINKKRRHKTLYALQVFKNDISFIDKSLAFNFEKLESSLLKSEKYQQRVFVQVKILERDVIKDDIVDADNIFFISHKNSNFVVLNVLYSPITKELYYLRTDKVVLPYYLKISFDFIKDIINSQ